MEDAEPRATATGAARGRPERNRAARGSRAARRSGARFRRSEKIDLGRMKKFDAKPHLNALTDL